MADTAHALTWKLEIEGVEDCPTGKVRLGFAFGAPLSTVLGDLSLAEQFEDAFGPVKGAFYRMWMAPPLSKEQCQMLLALLPPLMEPGDLKPLGLPDFLAALRAAIKYGLPVQVSINPPGHTDFGFQTTFCHCPRCKAEAPVERWKPVDPVFRVDCEACGHSYYPASTRSRERMNFADSVFCASCGRPIDVGRFSEEEYKRLDEDRVYREFVAEFKALRRVADLYRRHPELKEPFEHRSIDELFDGSGELAEPLDKISGGDRLSDADQQIITFLKYHHFSLQGRIRLARKKVEELAPKVASAFVGCPECHGAMY